MLSNKTILIKTKNLQQIEGKSIRRILQQPLASVINCQQIRNNFKYQGDRTITKKIKTKGEKAITNKMNTKGDRAITNKTKGDKTITKKSKTKGDRTITNKLKTRDSLNQSLLKEAS
jgi:hypothetical protein